jgi:ATP-dependent protease ClpP protease subunit
MKLVYYMSEDFSKESSIKLLDFLNNCVIMRDEEGNYPAVDIYLNSPGGLISEYQLIKDALENTELDITLICNEEISSCAFLLFYFTDNVNKKLLENTYAIIHTVDQSFSDRGRRSGDDYHTKLPESLNMLNQIYADRLRDHKILNSTQLKRYLKGEDITLNFFELKKVINNCPYLKK